MVDSIVEDKVAIPSDNAVMPPETSDEAVDVNTTPLAKSQCHSGSPYPRFSS